MNKFFLLSLSVMILTGCASVKKSNAHLNDLIAPDKLQADVEFLHRNLQNLHPNLYWHISKPALDHKFDSLKATISQPMTRLEFYKKLSPIVCAVREGHMYVYPPLKQYTNSQNDSIKKAGIGPLSQFDFDYIDGKLYVIENKSYDKSIEPGMELVAINGESPSEIINESGKYYTADGFNTTFKKNFSATRFATFYSYKHGIVNELKLDFKLNDSIKTTSIKRYADTTGTGKKAKKLLTSAERAKQKADAKASEKKKYENGYDDVTKLYNRNLRFVENDSSVAIMKIRGFTKGDANQFYEDSFKKIKNCKSGTLILDLRNNGGGRLKEIVELYSYLADSSFVFIDESEVVSRTSLVTQTPYWKGSNALIGTLKFIAAPFFYTYTYLKVHKNKEGKYVYGMNSKPQKVKPDVFKGKVYVLINGGSFSSSCIISSNLKGSKRAYFVGEETGGTFNGTVAGIMPELKLPASNVKIRVGLVFIAPHYKTERQGHGIFPDKEIIPTLQDRIAQRDPEMEWIFRDIKMNQGNSQ